MTAQNRQLLQQDRRYFKQHPGEWRYFRNLVSGETPRPTKCTRMLVIRIQGGVYRQPVYPIEEPTYRQADSLEALLTMLKTLGQLTDSQIILNTDWDYLS